MVWPGTFDWALVANVDTRSARDVVGEGALRGRSPRTREGRIGPTAQTAVVSGQWSEEALILAETEMGTDRGLVVAGVGGEVGPVLGCTQRIDAVDRQAFWGVELRGQLNRFPIGCA